MKRTIKTLFVVLALVGLCGSLTSCKKLLGLERQKDWEFNSVTLDPNIKMTAWEYLNKRAQGPAVSDSIFWRFLEGVRYAEIDSAEYMKPDRTYIFLHNDAVRRLSGSTVQTDSYYGHYKVSSPLRPANSWSEYPKDTVKKWLLYLIVEGKHTFENMTPVHREVQTLMPKGSNTQNPESIMTLRVNNTGNYNIVINDFVGSLRSTNVRTGGILATNGVIHVVDRIVEYRLP